ncbi:hypothetical protein E4U53_000799 [Claviceps sorghi]|nr:hypothetical protein E4U53_000799 [Claviceps sorghi]
MAHLNVKPDPAFLKLQAMQKTRHHFFRWTPRTARLTFTTEVESFIMNELFARRGSRQQELRLDPFHPVLTYDYTAEIFDGIPRRRVANCVDTPQVRTY